MFADELRHPREYPDVMVIGNTGTYTVCLFGLSSVECDHLPPTGLGQTQGKLQTRLSRCRRTALVRGHPRRGPVQQERGHDVLRPMAHGRDRRRRAHGLRRVHLAPSHPPPASACSDHTHSSPYRSIPCPSRPETRANHLRRSVGHAELQRGHPWQDCHLLRHKPRLTGRQREKRRETLATTLLLLPRLGSLPSARDTCP